MKKFLFYFFTIINFSAVGQNIFSIQGHFPNFPNSTYELKGFEGLQTKVLATYRSKDDGKFTLTYPANYKGVAHLYMNGNIMAILFLNQENFSIYWEDLTKRDDMQVSGSREYNDFLKGMKIFQDSEAKLAGWHYLLPLYEKDSLKQKIIAKELQEVAELFPNYVKSLPENRWVRQYLLAKGLTTQMPGTAQTYNWRAPIHVVEFNAIDFQQHYNSGLIKDIFEGYTNLLERYPPEENYPLFEKAIDKVVSELANDATIQHEVAQQWFSLLESKSLNKAAEYMALKMLKQDNCMLNEKSTAMFEQYRKLAIGNTSPNINLNLKNQKHLKDQKNLKEQKNLSDINAKYKLVVFGASWCPNCQTDYPKLLEKYSSLKEKYDLEIVYISIDTDKKAFGEFYNDAPFITYCDGGGWETQVAKDYHVFATPTYLLLDKNLKILAKIQSPQHLQAWLEAVAL